MATRYLPLSEEVFRVFMENTMGFQEVLDNPGTELIWEKVIPGTRLAVRVASSIRLDGKTKKNRNSIRVFLVDPLTLEVQTSPISIRRGPEALYHVRYHVGKLWKAALQS